VAAVVAALAWALVLRPQALGGPAGYVMVRGISMNPTYRTGDLVVTRPEPSYRRGDVVAYRVPKGEVGEGIVVIHRIVGGSARDGYVLQGDNNDSPDDWRPKRADVLGRAWLLLPRAGLVLGWLHAPLPLASLAAGVAIAMVLVPAGGEEAVRPSRGPRRRRAGARPDPVQDAATMKGWRGWWVVCRKVRPGAGSDVEGAG
jgi:signal peptidase I